MTTPTISASAACRLGIAAYGFEASSISPLPWFSVPTDECASVSTKPELREHPRRRRRQQHVADEADQVRERGSMLRKP